MQQKSTNTNVAATSRNAASKRRSTGERDCRPGWRGWNLRRGVSCWIALVVVVGLIAGPAAGVQPEPQPQTQTNATGGLAEAPSPTDRVNITYTLDRSPNERGHALVTANVTLPSDVSSFDISLPSAATVQRTQGFERDEPGTMGWEWNGSTRHASITYLASVNATSGGDLEGVATGQWALFDWRTVGIDWESERTDDGTETRPSETARVADQGVAGPNFAYLGPGQTYDRTVDGTTIRLVVPKHAQPANEPQAMLTALAKAERSLQLNARTTHVDVFVAPPPIGVSGRSGGVTRNDRHDMLVHQSKRLATPDNVLLHEYVHSKQRYDTTDEMEWINEGSAEYYGALLAYRQGLVSFETFRDFAVSEAYPESTLADRESWSSSRVAYRKGLRTFTALDATIRSRSNGTRSLEHVFRRLNQHEGEITDDVFATYVAEAAGESLTAWLDEHVESATVANVPTSEARYGQSGSQAADTTTGSVTAAVLRPAIANAPPVLFVGGIVLLLAGWARRPPDGSR